MECLRKVLTKLRQARLLLKLSKCKYAHDEVPHLGFIVSDGGVQPNPEKIKGHSQIVEQVLELTIKCSKQFQWTSDCRNSFDKFKLLLTTPPILAYPSFEEQFFVSTDASGWSLEQP
uniref:Reverse transcriptase/retrotransposon-derived protein RNase H-like domain-containing protein n=1 Tax=Amphimedon queenslandica TaxID=400682 RepID=A0A1X7TPJ6_AMPQE